RRSGFRRTAPGGRSGRDAPGRRHPRRGLRAVWVHGDSGLRVRRFRDAHAGGAAGPLSGSRGDRPAVHSSMNPFAIRGGTPMKRLSGASLVVLACVVAMAAPALAAGPTPVAHPIQQGFVEAHGVFLYYETIGSGPPLV